MANLLTEIQGCSSAILGNSVITYRGDKIAIACDVCGKASTAQFSIAVVGKSDGCRHRSRNTALSLAARVVLLRSRACAAAYRQ
jgi:hypothetical protein